MKQNEMFDSDLYKVYITICTQKKHLNDRNEQMINTKDLEKLVKLPHNIVYRLCIKLEKKGLIYGYRISHGKIIIWTPPENLGFKKKTKYNTTQHYKKLYEKTLTSVGINDIAKNLTIKVEEWKGKGFVGYIYGTSCYNDGLDINGWGILYGKIYYKLKNNETKMAYYKVRHQYNDIIRGYIIPDAHTLTPSLNKILTEKIIKYFINKGMSEKYKKIK